MAEHRNLDEELFELVIKKAVIDETDAECETIYEKYKDSAEPHYSESHQQRMEKLIRSSIKKEKHYGHWVRNVVAVFIAVVAIGASMLSVEAVRFKIVGWIASLSGGNVNISSNYQKYIPTDWDGAWFLQSSSIQMDIRESTNTSEVLYLFYVDNDNKETILFQSPKDRNFVLNGGVEQQTAFIQDNPAVITYENGQYSVYWTVDEWQFILVSPYDYETSLRLAGDLEYIKAL